MVGGRRSLCGRCGSSRWEELSATQVRCAECGLTATRTTLTAYRAAGYDALAPAEVARREHDVRQRAEAARVVFAEAAFAPIGLDEQWTGLRWFGGSGTSNGVVTHLELAHGDNPFDESQPQVRVRATIALDLPLALVRRTVARSLLQHFWHGTGVLPDDVRRAAFPRETRDGDPTEPWDSRALRLDGELTEFRVLDDDDYWVALAAIDDVVVSVQTRAWPVQRTGLVRIADLEPYFTGAIEVGRRPT